MCDTLWWHPMGILTDGTSENHHLSLCLSGEYRHLSSEYHPLSLCLSTWSSSVWPPIDICDTGVQRWGGIQIGLNTSWRCSQGSQWYTVRRPLLHGGMSYARVYVSAEAAPSWRYVAPSWSYVTYLLHGAMSWPTPMSCVSLHMRVCMSASVCVSRAKCWWKWVIKPVLPAPVMTDDKYVSSDKSWHTCDTPGW